MAMTAVPPAVGTTDPGSAFPARLASSFLNAGLIDRWVRYLAPVVLGDGIGWPGGVQHPEGRSRDFSLTRHERVGDDLMVIHDRRNLLVRIQYQLSVREDHPYPGHSLLQKMLPSWKRIHRNSWIQSLSDSP